MLKDDGELHTPSIQIVCQRLWNDLVRDRQNGPVVTASDCDEATVKDVLKRYLDFAVNEIRPPELIPKAQRVLRALASTRPAGPSQAASVSEQDIASAAGVDQDVANELIRQLNELRLIEVEGVKGHHHLRIIHDFLAQEVMKNYDEPLVFFDVRQDADRLAESLTSILTVGIEESASEAAVFAFARDFLRNQYINWRQLVPADQRHALESLTLRPGSLGAYDS